MHFESRFGTDGPACAVCGNGLWRGQEHLGEADFTSYALPILISALDVTQWAHVTHPGRLARVTGQEKGSAMTNPVHGFGYAGDGITRGG